MKKNQKGSAIFTVIALLALPLFVFAVVRGGFDIRKRAASGEPTIQPTFSPTIKPTPTPYPTKTPTPYPSPTRPTTPTPWPTKTPTPIPSPIASSYPTTPPASNSVPVITTRAVRIATLNKYYTVKINGYDKKPSRWISMTATNLPKGLTLGNCYTSSLSTQLKISCNIYGTPRESGAKMAIITLTDDGGLSATRYIPIYVSRPIKSFFSRLR